MYAVILTTFKDSLSKEAELTGIYLSLYHSGDHCHSYQSLNKPDDQLHTAKPTGRDSTLTKAVTNIQGFLATQFCNLSDHKSTVCAVK